MARAPRIIWKEVSVTGDGTGWDSRTLPELGVSGYVRVFKLRQTVGGNATSTDIYLAKTNNGWNKASVPDDMDAFYTRTGHVPTAHATTASLAESLGETAPYEVPAAGDLAIAFNTTAAGGAFTFNLLFGVELGD